MGRTRFMVVKAKELIKTAVFAVLGVIILVGLIAFFLNMGKHDGAYRDGTYYEEMQLGEETAEIAVTIAEGRIAEVSMEEATEAVALFYPLLAEVTETLKENEAITQVYRVTGKNKLHVHAVAASSEEMEKLIREVIDPLPGVVSCSCNIILSRIKDIKGLRL